MTNGQRVLVTGGSGYVAGYVIARLLDAGYRVRATLRDINRAEATKANIASVTKNVRLLEFVQVDLLTDDGWDDAMKGVDAVMHVASPMRAGKDVLNISVDGTQRVLRAANRAGVKRMVVTSSGVAARLSDSSHHAADETAWTDLKAPGVSDYARSKTMAEQAAWTFSHQHVDAPRLATILPGLVQGPLLGQQASASLAIVEKMLAGQMPATLRIGFCIVDVRDLADFRVRLLDEPSAFGQRWIASADFLWMSDIAAILRQEFGTSASKVPTRTMPDWLVRLMSFVNEEIRPLIPDLGKRREVTSAKAQASFDWHPRSAREAVIATARSVLEQKS